MQPPRYKKPESKRARALYSTVDPRMAYPDSYFDAAKLEAAIRWKMAFGDPDKMEYELGDDIGSKVSDAAWRKRLGFGYNETFLPRNGNAVRLPLDLEREIPVDTTFLKNRIKRTELLMNYSRKYKKNKYINLARDVDQETLDALRKTYKTGQPVTVNEHSFNSRLWVDNGNIKPTMSPLNVLLNYTLLYDSIANKMNYMDKYDFNQFEWAIPGKPFDIRGSIDLQPRKSK